MFPEKITSSEPGARIGRRYVRNGEVSKVDILRAATQEFLDKGYSGARVQLIADQANVSKRMLYYYYGDKRGLYVAVLSNYLAEMRAAELDVAADEDDADPIASLLEIAAMTFDFHLSWVEETRLMMIENMERGKNIGAIGGLSEDSRLLVDRVQRLLDLGVEQGVVRPGITALDLYASISSLAFFNVSSRYTFSRIFKRDMTSTAAVRARRAQVVELVRRYISR